jgi:hypothetical protein
VTVTISSDDDSSCATARLASQRMWRSIVDRQ